MQLWDHFFAAVDLLIETCQNNAAAFPAELKREKHNEYNNEILKYTKIHFKKTEKSNKIK